ncbi:MAG: FHA domain-containing protein [Bdellovibrionales bacterium]
MDIHTEILIEVKLNKQSVFKGIVKEFPITIGRDESNDIPLQKVDFLSRNHIEINRVGTKVRVTDLKSSNGVFSNGEKITTTVIDTAQSFTVGELSVRISFHKIERKKSPTVGEEAEETEVSLIVDEKTFEFVKRQDGN